MDQKFRMVEVANRLVPPKRLMPYNTTTDIFITPDDPSLMMEIDLPQLDLAAYRYFSAHARTLLW